MGHLREILNLPMGNVNRYLAIMRHTAFRRASFGRILTTLGCSRRVLKGLSVIDTMYFWSIVNIMIEKGCVVYCEKDYLDVDLLLFQALSTR